MIKFSDLYLKNLAPRPARYEIREGEGFGVRVSPDGGKSFFFMYQLEGKKRRLTLGPYPDMTLKEARKAYFDARALVAQGRDPIAERDDAKAQVKREREEREAMLTVAKLAHDYIERHAKPNKRTWANDDAMLKREILPIWGERKAADINRRDINQLLDSITDRGSPIMANRVLSLVSKMFNFGMQRGELTGNPCLGVGKPAPEQASDRVLTEEETRRLWLALDTGAFRATELITLAIKLLLLTGARVGELIGTRWEEIDWSSGWWEIPAERMKNKRPHRVWLTAPAVEAFERLQALQTTQGRAAEWVFLSPALDKPMVTTSPAKAITRNAPALGIEPFSPHDLRRTVATRLGELNTQPHIIGKVLSHSDSSVTGKHYDKWSYDREKRLALESWERRLREIVTGERQSNVVTLAR